MNTSYKKSVLIRPIRLICGPILLAKPSEFQLQPQLQKFKFKKSSTPNNMNIPYKKSVLIRPIRLILR